MMNTPQVHPSAYVHPEAQVAGSARIGPNVVVDADVIVGEETDILVGSYLQSGSRIGKRCRIGPYAIIAGEPMDTKFKGEPSLAVIEDDVVLRDFVTVHRATGEGAETRVGQHSYVMSYGHVSHNVLIGVSCTLTTNVQLGGHSEIGDHAVLGANALTHQFSRVGPYVMLGALGGANRDVLPFSLARHTPAKHYRLNSIGLKRHGIVGERYHYLEHAIRAFRRRDWNHLADLAKESDDVAMMLEFKENSKRGLCSFIK